MTASPPPPGTLRQATRADALATEMPVGRTRGWWGMVFLIATEATVFALLLGSYFYLRFQSGRHWPPPGIEKPELTKAIIMTILLLPSSLPVVWAERGIRRGQPWRLRLGLSLTLIQGLLFLSVQASEYATNLKKFTITTDVYGSLFYATTGFHGFHVTIGLVMVAWLLAASLRGSFGARHHDRVTIVALYWHFVDIVWAFIFMSLYLSPRL
ncbi:cytochrome c oxidase subunit 3 [Rhizomonospora bruguierae]|uniref:cytochrome c oxidase subunit 3 n=1 Tax=Rhizomonospora bruguierae TaxID=1581705 RepID=UPI001BCFB166|nr:cytochrome c oxidase subunit 3 [Micromonospora sp. NBRC 107566]